MTFKPKQAWIGPAWRGLGRPGLAWQVWRGKAWPVPVRHGKVWQAWAGMDGTGGARWG